MPPLRFLLLFQLRMVNSEVMSLFTASPTNYQLTRSAATLFATVLYFLESNRNDAPLATPTQSRRNSCPQMDSAHSPWRSGQAAIGHPLRTDTRAARKSHSIPLPTYRQLTS